MQPNRSVPVPSGPPYTNGRPPSRTDLLARALAGEILAGRHPVGAMLPSESELVDDHGASIATVRGALRVLGTLGLTQRGRGGIAQVVSGEVRAIYEIATGEGAEGGGYLAPTRIGLDRQRRAIADAELAVLLDARENSDWLHVTGLRLPVDPSFGPLSWFDGWVGGAVKAVPDGFEFTAEALEELCGAQIAEVREDMSAAPLTPAQARRLHARGGGFALHIMRRFLRGNGSLVAAVLDVHPAGRVVVHSRARRDG